MKKLLIIALLFWGCDRYEPIDKKTRMNKWSGKIETLEADGEWYSKKAKAEQLKKIEEGKELKKFKDDMLADIELSKEEEEYYILDEDEYKINGLWGDGSSSPHLDVTNISHKYDIIKVIIEPQVYGKKTQNVIANLKYRCHYEKILSVYSTKRTKVELNQTRDFTCSGDNFKFKKDVHSWYIIDTKVLGVLIED